MTKDDTEKKLNKENESPNRTQNKIENENTENPLSALQLNVQTMVFVSVAHLKLR